MPRPRFVFALCLTLLGCQRAEPGRTMTGLRELTMPAAPGSGEPNLAVGPGGRVLVSWIEPAGSGHRLRLAHRRKGQEWSEPRTIAQGKGWFVNWADFPSVLALADGSLVAHWLARSGPSTYAYDVRLAASRDGGLTWGDPLVPHRDRTQTEHGFVSLLPWPGGKAGVVWLDGRHTVPPTPGGPAGRPAVEAEMALMHTTLGPDGRLGPETVLDSRVCDCCQTAAAATDEGAIVAYRDRSPDEVRDISVVRFAEGGWSAPQTLSPDGWEIDGCPVNGPAVVAAGRQVVVAWHTAPREQARVKAAFSADAGLTWDPPVTVDDGRPLGRVDVALLPGGAALVSWLEQSPKGAELRARRIAPDGTRGPSTVVADSSAARSSGFPRLEWADGEAVFAWRDPADPPQVRTAVLELAR